MATHAEHGGATRGDDAYHFSGLPTFMRAPAIDADEARAFDVVVLGVPSDDGMSFRGGQRHAPRAIREYSGFKRADGTTMADTSTGAVVPTRAPRIGDAGDVVVWPGQHERTLESVRSSVAAVRRASFPLVLGGDHSITYGAYLGCRDALAPEQLPLGVLHFDAHLDTEGPWATLPPIHHGNPFSRLIDDGFLEGSHLVSVGIRGWADADLVSAADAYGTRRFGMDEIAERSLAAVVDDAVEHLLSTCRSVYLSFDVDCLDPAELPGTGTPSFGGLRVFEVTRAIRALARLPLVGLDLVELAPELDPTGRSTYAACIVLWNLLCFAIPAGSGSAPGS